MGLFSNLNSNSTIKEGISLDGMEFKPIKDFIGDEVLVDGFYFNSKSKYGEQVVVVGNGCLINMPSWAVKDFKSIRDNEEQLNAVLTGHLKLTDIKQTSTKNGTTTSYSYTEC